MAGLAEGRTERVTIAACVALLWLAGCAGGPTSKQEPPASAEERQAYQAAIADVERDPTAAATQLDAFVRLHPQSPLADDAAVRLAQLDLERGDAQAAEGRLRWAITQHPRGDRSDVARLLLAEQLRERGELDASWELASQMRLSMLTDAERHSAHRMLADLAGQRGDAVEQLRWLGRLRAEAVDSAELAAVDAEIDQVIATRTRPELVAAGDELGRRVPAARVWLRVAELSLRAGDTQGAEEALEVLRRLPLTPEEAQRMAALEGLEAGRGPAGTPLPPPLSDFRGSAPRPVGATGTLGVVLPLSGPLDWVGQQSLRGVLLAAGIYSQDGSAPDVRVLVRDSGGKPERAAEAVHELALREQVSAIIGPLMAEETRAAADAAERAEMPLLTLTRRESVARGRGYVFRVGTTRVMEAELLAEYAVRDLGLARFAILYPRDAYGREFETLWWKAIEARGGTIVGVASYDPAATDFSTPIRQLIGYALLTEDEKRLLSEREKMLARAKRLPPERAAELREEARAMEAPGGEPLPPIVDFDALFVPDAHDKVALLAPQLAFNEVQGVRLFGSSGWQDPELLEIAGKHVEGAVFTAPFDEANPSPVVQDFARRYVAAYGEAPGVFAAQAYDATNLALLQLAAGRMEPEAMRQGLLEVGLYPGVAGVLAFEPDGNARKRPFLIEIREGKTVSLDAE